MTVPTVPVKASVAACNERRIFAEETHSDEFRVCVELDRSVNDASPSN